MAARVFATVYLIMIVVMFAAPLIGPEGYSLLRHTTSQLAAQNSPNAWAMRAVFVALSAASLLAVWPVLPGLPFQRSHAPTTPGVLFDATEDLWHSRFADATGAGFTLLAASTGFVEPRGRRSIAFAVAIAAVMLSLAMAALPEFRGLFQRAIFIGGFGWLLLLARWRSAD
jgi:hypothetical protein